MSSSEEEGDSSSRAWISDSSSSHTPHAGRELPSQALDAEGVALLREIFPGQSDEELSRLHQQRLQMSVLKRQPGEGGGPSSRLGQRIWNQALILHEGTADEQPEPLCWREHNLPDDFLRLPAEVAIREYSESRGRWEYQLVKEMEQRVVKQHTDHLDILGRPTIYSLDEKVYTRVLIREPEVGLGMTLCEQDGCIWVHSLVGRDGSRWHMKPPDDELGGPSLCAGIRPGDWLLGVQGNALLPSPTGSLLNHAVSAIRYAPDPVVLHLRHFPPHPFHPLVEMDGTLPNALHNSPSLLDTTVESVDSSVLSDPDFFIADSTSPRIHPFVSALVSKGLIRTIEDQVAATASLEQYTTRTRQWESTHSFRIDDATFALRHHFDPRDLPPSHSADKARFGPGDRKIIRPYAPSTPMLDPKVDPIPLSDMEQYGMFGGQLESMSHGGLRSPYPGDQRRNHDRGDLWRSELAQSDIFIPLVGVRKALCVRIVNSFLEDTRTAFTIWVYDVESGREWYAPVRYLRDFEDLRSATVRLSSSISKIPFPSVPRWITFGKSEKSETEGVRDEKCRQLEHFLRALCTRIYTDSLHPGVVEIAIHIQSFLGCDVGLGEMSDPGLHLQNQVVMNENMWGQKQLDGHTDLQMSVRLLLKRAIQRYCFRLFLLGCMKQTVDDFVDNIRSYGLKLHEIELLEAQGQNVLKEKALRELEKIHAFLDQVQDLILTGCRHDFESIAKRRDFSDLRTFLCDKKDTNYLERLVREAVREQIEIEIYVPLRTAVSRLLVNGWRHDDIVMHFKMQELRKRPQNYFKIPGDEQSPSGWRSVSSIMNDGIGMSTLPCAKLRAIVDAAREINRVHSKEHGKAQTKVVGSGSTNEIVPTLNGDSPRSSTLSADHFLPIFIYSVVNAELERPSALCVLLRTLCDSTSRIGEIGYYQASFEAALTHIYEMDLTKESGTTSFSPVSYATTNGRSKD